MVIGAAREKQWIEMVDLDADTKVAYLVESLSDRLTRFSKKHSRDYVSITKIGEERFGRTHIEADIASVEQNHARASHDLAAINEVMELIAEVMSNE